MESFNSIQDFGLFIAVVPLIGFILNYTPGGIRLPPVLIPLSMNLSPASWRGRSFLDRGLSIILIVAILGAMGTLGYIIATPKAGERFTEFFVLGLEGKAIDYPGELRVGEEGRVIVGIINRQHETVSYQLEVRIDGVRNTEVGPLVLEHDEGWEEIVSFAPGRIGDNQKVEFLLYKNGENEPHLEPLYLWVNVNK